MKYKFIGAIALSAAAVIVGVAAEQAARGPLSRSLTVEQAAVYDVQPPTRADTGRDDALKVLAWVDRPDYTYATGEDVQVFVETSKDAYVTVLNVDPAGETTVLFPNQYRSDNFVAAGRAVKVPDPSARFRIVVSGSVGTELLKVIASTRPTPLFEAQQLSEAGPFQRVRAQPMSIARSLNVVMTEGRPSSPPAPDARSERLSGAGVSEWAMCHQAITTIPVLSPAARRTRSLTVQRTEESRGSVTCEEAK